MAQRRGDRPSGASGVDPSTLNWLRYACSVCQDYDLQGDTVVRTDAFPRILQELQIREGSREEDLLRCYCEPAGQGYFSYLPMLRALGVALDVGSPPWKQDQPQQQQQGRSPEQQRQRDQPQQYEQQQHRPPSGAQSGAPPYPSDSDYGYGGRHADSRPQDATLRPGTYAGLADTASPGSPDPYAGNCNGQRDGGGGSAGQSPARPGANYPTQGDVGSEVSVDLLEDEERFWSKRGPAIQNLFQQWDCNGMTNEAFSSQLQALLGQRVDILSPDSDFMKLTNKHKVARNMKFASLTVALRQDAKKTAQKRAGTYAASQCSFSELGASEVASSAAGCEPPSYAAGKPTRSLGDVDPLGRKRVNGPDMYNRPESASGADMWRRSTAQWPPREGDDSTSVASSSKASQVSMADSAREEFIQRGRGHGNILTWGSDSRALTPVQKRRGRGMVTDASRGVTRGQEKTGVFAHG